MDYYSVGLKRYTGNLSIVYLWRTILWSGLALTFTFVLVNAEVSWRWVNQPFAGFLHRNHVASANGLPNWPVWQEEIEAGDIILTIDGQERSAAVWLDYLRELGSNQPVTYLLRKQDGRLIEVVLPTTRFTGRDFIQLVAIPVFIASSVIIVTGILIYLRPYQPVVRLFALYILATTYFLTSQPDFSTDGWFTLNFATLVGGGVLTPPLLVHFFLLFPYPKRVLRAWNFLIPLLYLPVLPILIYLPTLLKVREAMNDFEQIIDVYISLYTIGGIVALLRTYQVGDSLIRKEVAILLIGLIIPVALFIFTLFNTMILTSSFRLEPIHETLRRYIFWITPLAILFTFLRYEILGLRRSNHRRVFYISVVYFVLIMCIALIGVDNSLHIGLSRLRLRDIWIILLTALTFFIGRFFYRRILRWWTERNLIYSMEDFKINLRILSGELLKIKTRRELEALISWNLPSDFRLQSAELSLSGVPSSHYALQLPLSISNISLGMLFLGPKINGEEFTDREREIFAEVQNQISLTVFSLELDEAIRATAELTRLKSKFLANVTHELRTPLNAIINYIGFVLDDAEGLNEEQVYHLSQALQGAERLLELINNILDMSKIEAGQMTLVTRPVDLTEIVRRMMPVVDDMLHNKPINVITNVASDLPVIRGDHLRLRQIILNMMSNAVNFTERGAIQLNVYPDNGHVIVEVADTGCGIDQTILPTIFQGFTTAELIDAGPARGPGLGLPITKYLVELHEGHIEVASKVGVGTTFTVSLPVNEIEEN